MCCKVWGMCTGMCTSMSSDNFCEIAVKCLVIVLQTNFSTGTNKASISKNYYNNLPRDSAYYPPQI